MAVSQTQEFGILSGISSLPGALDIGSGPPLGITASSMPCVERYFAKESGSRQRSFRGRIIMDGIRCFFPEQAFVETRTDDLVILSNDPEGKWPTIVIELRRDGPNTPFRCTGMRVQHRDNSAESWLLLTRFMFCATSSDTWSIVDDQDAVLKLVPRIDPALALELRHLSSAVRKLSYIGSVFKIAFEIPDTLSRNDLLMTELIFRAITEGEFAVRSSEVIFRRLIPSKLNFHKPPFTSPGSFTCLRNGAMEEMSFSLLGHTIYMGSYEITVKRGEIASQSALREIDTEENDPADIKLYVYDHQVAYKFASYVGKRNRKITLQQHARFKSLLAAEEPDDLVNLMDESLQLDVSSLEASQIAIGWLEYNHFPDRYCPQTPMLDEREKEWHVPIHLAYPSGKGGGVGALNIDAKTGVVVSESSVGAMRAKGAALAESLLNAE